MPTTRLSAVASRHRFPFTDVGIDTRYAFLGDPRIVTMRAPGFASTNRNALDNNTLFSYIRTMF
jgi:hypothetical protein